MKVRFVIVSAAVVLLALSLVYFFVIVEQSSAQQSTLRAYAEKLGIRVGAQIEHPGQLGKDEPGHRILGKEFNLAGASVVMRLIKPEPNKFDIISLHDQMIFAKEKNLKLLGHRLIDDNEPASLRPQWLKFDQPDCGGWSREELDQIMKKYIQDAVAHGDDFFYAWVVVNEPFRTKVSLHTDGCWYRILGEDYISNAFRYAHEANPKTLLILNEHFGADGVDQTKTDSYFTLIKKLKEKEVPVHVAGIQMHLEAHKLRPTYQEEFRYFIRKAVEIGVQVYVTEMDVYQGPAGFFEKPFEKQKEIFKNILSTCLEFSNCTGFITFGVTDKYTWLRTSPFGTWEAYPDAKPLLFDDNYEKKPAYYGVIEALKESISRRAG